MFDFPDTPTTNQIVEGPAGQFYIWDGDKWMHTPGGAQYTVGPAAPSPARTGDLWYDTATGRLNIFSGSVWIMVDPVDGGTW